MFGSILPSLVTIVSNFISVYRIRAFNHVASNRISFCRRRKDDTRRVLFVITVECLLAILNSWFMDIFLSLVYCKKKLLADDDCPLFLQQNFDFLVMFDLFNSLSNIVLHCLSGTQFRRELMAMVRSCFGSFKNVIPGICYCPVKFRNRWIEDDHFVTYHASVSRRNDSSSSNPSQIFVTIQSSSQLFKKRCFSCCWYFNRKPVGTLRKLSSTASNSQPAQSQPTLLNRSHLTTEQPNVSRSMQLLSNMWNNQSSHRLVQYEVLNLNLSLHLIFSYFSWQ